MEENTIQSDPVIKRLLEKMPEPVAESFNEEQLSHLRNAIGAREWGRHKVDLRGTIKFFRWRYYYVILAGRNKRDLSPQERRLALFLNSCIVTGFITISVLFGGLVLYLIKSALGIDLIPGHSWGVWSWFKETFM